MEGGPVLIHAVGFDAAQAPLATGILLLTFLALLRAEAGIGGLQVQPGARDRSMVPILLLHWKKSGVH